MIYDRCVLLGMSTVLSYPHGFRSFVKRRLLFSQGRLNLTTLRHLPLKGIIGRLRTSLRFAYRNFLASAEHVPPSGQVSCV